MNTIQKLKQKVGNKDEIWIIGSSPTIDSLPDNFFDDKTTIALNYTFQIFPNCSFIHAGHREVYELIRDKYPKYLKKSIFYNTIFRNPVLDFTADSKESYYVNWDSYSIDEIRDRFVEAVDNGKIFRSYKSILHTAIQIAFYLGASKIILVGCEGKKIKDRYHTRLLPRYYNNEQPIYLDKVNKGTKWLKEILKEYGTEIRYYSN